MAPGEGDAGPARSALSAPDAWEAALESAPPARGSRPPSRAPGAGAATGLDEQSPYRSQCQGL